VKRISIIVMLLAICLPVSGAFRASVVKMDITPKTAQWLMGYGPRTSTGVHDPIFHRIVAMDDGKTQFYLIASDLCLFSPGFYDEATERLRRDLGIERRTVWWSVTHTHSAPEVGPPGLYKALLGRSDHEWNREYAATVTDALVEGVKVARAKLEPAHVGIGVGISMANINRRAKDVDGSVSLGLNPDGPTDRQMGIIRLDRPDGSPIGVVVNYAMHGTVLGPSNLDISGDAPGTVSAYLEQKIGAPVLYVNGAAGNLAPIYSVYPDAESGHLSQFRVLIGDRLLEALRSLSATSTDVTLWTGETIVETPRRAGLIWPEELSAFSHEGQKPMMRLPIRFLKIGETIIWSAPLELFCEIGIAIRNRSPFTHTFYFGYTGGWLGYLPTKDGFEEGGYEPKTSPFTERAEQDLLANVTTYIQGLKP